LDAFSAAIIVNIAFSFIPASFAVPIVKVCIMYVRSNLKLFWHKFFV